MYRDCRAEVRAESRGLSYPSRGKDAGKDSPENLTSVESLPGCQLMRVNLSPTYEIPLLKGEW